MREDRGQFKATIKLVAADGAVVWNMSLVIRTYRYRYQETEARLASWELASGSLKVQRIWIALESPGPRDPTRVQAGFFGLACPPPQQSLGLLLVRFNVPPRRLIHLSAGTDAPTTSAPPQRRASFARSVNNAQSTLHPVQENVRRPPQAGSLQPHPGAAPRYSSRCVQIRHLSVGTAAQRGDQLRGAHRPDEVFHNVREHFCLHDNPNDLRSYHAQLVFILTKLPADVSPSALPSSVRFSTAPARSVSRYPTPPSLPRLPFRLP